MIALEVPIQLWLLVLLACALDRLVGDPIGWPHPVQAMGWLIQSLRAPGERWAGDHPRRLRLVGLGLTAALVGLSGLAGWSVEQLALAAASPLQLPAPLAWFGLPLLLVALASALAAGSLESAVRAVLAPISGPGKAAGVDLEALEPQEDLEGEGLEEARRRLAWIVGRDVEGLGRAELMRAVAETASENAVDGLFGPLFWMLAGAGIWVIFGLADGAPGPLSLAWMYKAASTLDSMLGYRHGRLRWLGTAGARLDDLLTWLPARLVAFSLPLVSGRPLQLTGQLGRALREGRSDPSPNAGLSQAAYAQAARVQLGGLNRYRGAVCAKPLLGVGFAPADGQAVETILVLSRRLEGFWLLIALALALLAERLGTQ